MAIPSTSNKDQLFVTRQPAWEMKVRLRQALKCDVWTARSGLEQRQGRQSKSRWALQYSATLDRTAALAREVRTAAEITAPLVVPFWTERTATTTPLASNAVTIARAPDEDFFTVGEWVYFLPVSGTASFRQIASIAGSVLTFVPDGAAPTYGSSGVPCWPCKLCTRDAGSVNVRRAIDNSETETLNFTTL